MSRTSQSAANAANIHSQPASTIRDRDEPAPLATRDSVSFNLRRLEPWVSWSIAIYTAWIAVFAFPQVPALWCFVLYAGLLGQWCRVRPPRQQFGMFTRAAALILGAYMLHSHTSTELGGAGGIFFFWLSITTLYYAFMLRPAWAAALVGVAVGEYLISWLENGSTGGFMMMVAQGGYLAIFPMFVAMRFGAAMRRPDEAMEESRIDRASGLYNKAGLVEYGGELLDACRREKKAATMAVFDCEQLRDLRALYGRKVSRRLTASVVAKFNALAADRGMVARTGPTEFTVVLFGRGREKALAAIQRELGEPARIELTDGDMRMVIKPRFLLETLGQEMTSLCDLHDELSADLADLAGHSQPVGGAVVLRGAGPLAALAEEAANSPSAFGFTPTEADDTLTMNLMGAKTMPAPLTA